MITPNETDKSAPCDTITGEDANQIGALQAIVPCDTNLAQLTESYFSCSRTKSFRILLMFKPLLILDAMDKTLNCLGAFVGLKILKKSLISLRLKKLLFRCNGYGHVHLERNKQITQ